MLHDPEHRLPPLHRRAIYKLFQQYGYKEGVGRIAVLTAQRVLPLWSQEYPSNDLPQRLLQQANALLRGTGDRRLAELVAGEAWQQLEESSPEAEGGVSRAIYAGDAAREALVATLGRAPFGDALLTTKTTDADLDPWSSDTALWAALAWAGDVWQHNSNPTRRREFWRWWLTEAVPTTWLDVAVQGR